MQSVSHSDIEEHEDPKTSPREGGTRLVGSCKIKTFLGFVFQYPSSPLPPMFWRDVDPKIIIFPGVPKTCSPSFSYTMQPACKEWRRKVNKYTGDSCWVETLMLSFQQTTHLCSHICLLQVNRELSCN